MEGRILFEASLRTKTDHSPYTRNSATHRQVLRNDAAGACCRTKLPRRWLLMLAPPLVSIVDDDVSVRESLPDLLKEYGLIARAFDSAEAFLASDCVSATRCLILDVAMPGMSGPELQDVLMARQANLPIIFITAHSNAKLRAQVLEQGAAAFLSKPFSDTALLTALNAALRPD
jgi:FixJ family two-component response regulator